jgi:hypothetical protein
MPVMVRSIAGVFVPLPGLVLPGPVGYNLLVEMQPAARGVNPLPAIFFSLAFLYVGQKWIRSS